MGEGAEQRTGAGAARVAFDDLAEAGVGHQPQHACLLDCALEVAETDRRGEVEQRPRGRGDRDAAMDGPFERADVVDADARPRAGIAGRRRLTSIGPSTRARTRHSAAAAPWLTRGSSPMARTAAISRRADRRRLRRGTRRDGAGSTTRARRRCAMPSCVNPASRSARAVRTPSSPLRAPRPGDRSLTGFRAPREPAAHPAHVSRPRPAFRAPDHWVEVAAHEIGACPPRRTAVGFAPATRSPPRPARRSAAGRARVEERDRGRAWPQFASTTITCCPRDRGTRTSAGRARPCG